MSLRDELAQEKSKHSMSEYGDCRCGIHMQDHPLGGWNTHIADFLMPIIERHLAQAREQGFAEAQAAVLNVLGVKIDLLSLPTNMSLVGVHRLRGYNEGREGAADIVRNLKLGDSRPLERMLTEARLDEAKHACHDYSAIPHTRFNPVGNCDQCRRIAELEAKLKEQK